MQILKENEIVLIKLIILSALNKINLKKRC